MYFIYFIFLVKMCVHFSKHSLKCYEDAVLHLHIIKKGRFLFEKQSFLWHFVFFVNKALNKVYCKKLRAKTGQKIHDTLSYYHLVCRNSSQT